MANQSTFPTTLDGTPTDMGSGDTILSSQWNQYMDAIDQLETKVGIDSSAVTASIDYQIKTLPASGIKSRVVQVVNTQTGEVATGATTIPLDDTIPLSGEGDQYMSLSITPTNSNNILIIQVQAFISESTNTAYIMALFQDGIANALAAIVDVGAGVGYYMPMTLTHKMLAGTTSSTTFKVRAGGSGASTTTFNGIGGARYFGGVMSSFITITEIAV